MKKLTTLHILNGDATLPVFTSAELPGQVLVWREILSEGPVLYVLPEEPFWQTRQSYITSTYGDSPENYKSKVLDELPKLQSAGAFFEVVLWFDADMMCQINLLYLLHRLHKIKPERVSVCTPAGTTSIALLKPEQLHELFENREEITEQQLQEAATTWQLYSSPAVTQLQNYIQEHTFKLPHLKQALQLHLKRFPDCNTGLSEPHMLLLQIISKGGATMQDIQQKFTQEELGYGFGDWQLKQLLRQLHPDLITEQEPYTLTLKGKQVLSETGKSTTWLQAKPWLGGIQLQEEHTGCFSSDERKLIV